MESLECSVPNSTLEFQHYKRLDPARKVLPQRNNLSAGRLSPQKEYWLFTGQLVICSGWCSSFRTEIIT